MSDDNTVELDDLIDTPYLWEHLIDRVVEDHATFIIVDDCEPKAALVPADLLEEKPR